MEKKAESSSSNVENRFGIRIERGPPQSRLSDLGIHYWPKMEGKETMELSKIRCSFLLSGCKSHGSTLKVITNLTRQDRKRWFPRIHRLCQSSIIFRWGCPPGRFPLTFDAEETCYLVKGKVKAYPKGCSDYIEFGAGDLVVFPKGLSCTWDVSIAVDKHYKFD